MPSSTLPIYWPDCGRLSDEAAGRFEENAGSFWEAFYKQHGSGFFKDRHYLHREFPGLLDGALTVFEVGCGVGNTAIPILEVNPQASVYACDFSSTAITCLQQHDLHCQGRIKAFVADITKDRLSAKVPSCTVDIVTMVFVLSAISPSKMKLAVHNVKDTMRSNGLVFVRDYAAGDMAEGRLTAGHRLKRIEQHFYVRGDGTRAYYFSKGELAALFASCGFSCCYVDVCERTVENQALGVSMQRRWIQGLFKLTGQEGSKDAEPESPAVLTSSQRDEWEEAAQPAEAEGALEELFGGKAAQEEREEVINVSGVGDISVCALGRENRNVLTHTGLMLWDAAPAFAAYLAAAKAFLEGSVVLELGCGCNPLCMLAALRSARRVVSTDGSLPALERMAANISKNSSKFIVERARLQKLAWGDAEQIQRMLRQYPCKFDVILGADIVYVPESMPSLFQTADCLLRDDPQARLLLCHLTRRVGEDTLTAAAEAAGFSCCAPPAVPLKSRCNDGGFRLLAFAKTF